MINSTQDEMIPTTSARALYDAAGEPKKLLWYETGHMDLFDREVLCPMVADAIWELTAAGYLNAAP